MRIERLSDVMAEPRQVLYATCPRCSHNIGLDLAALLQRHGDLTLDELESRLRCRRCGRRGAQTTMVWSTTGPAR